MKAVSVAYSGVIFHGMLKNCRHSPKSEIDYAGCFEMRGGKTDGASSPLVDESRHRLLFLEGEEGVRGMDLCFLTRD